MFSLNYFWFFVVAQLFFEPLRVYAKGPLVGSNPLFKQLSMIVAGLLSAANIVFLILGFWFMPHWYYPLIFGGVSLIIVSLCAWISAYTHYTMLIMAMLGLILSPIFFVLAYLGMFDVI